MKIIYPLHVTSFDTLSDDEKNEAETAGEDMMCSIIYLDNSYKARFMTSRSTPKTTMFEQGRIPKDFYCGTEYTFKLATKL